jgi:hypothetical protein
MTQRKVWCTAVKDMVPVKGEISHKNPLPKLTVEHCSRESTCIMKGTEFCQVGKTLTGQW